MSRRLDRLERVLGPGDDRVAFVIPPTNQTTEEAAAWHAAHPNAFTLNLGSCGVKDGLT